MSATLSLVRDNVRAGRVRVSEHALQELQDDDIDLRDVVSGLEKATPVEDYPEYWKGPSVLCLQRDWNGKPLHVLWGIAKRAPETSTIITGYRPDPGRWSDDFMTRRQK